MDRKKSRQPRVAPGTRGSLLYCDLTQSWSEQGGGVRTYLLHKRQHILERTSDRHLLIIPGVKDEVVEEGRAVTVTIASRRVPGSPNYRLLLRNGAVRKVLERFRPDLIECQDAYNLPWTALAYRKRHPGTAVTAAYMTDFPTVYVDRPFSKFVGRAARHGSAPGFAIPMSAAFIGGSTGSSPSASTAGRPNCARLEWTASRSSAWASIPTSSGRSAAIRSCARRSA